MKKLLLVLTHTLALGAGWLAFRSPAGAEVSLAAREEPSGKSRRDRNADREEGRRLLKEMRAGWGTEARVEAVEEARAARPGGQASIDKLLRDHRTEMAEEMDKILKQAAATVLPADPAAEMERLKKGDDRPLAAFAAAWLQQDPEAALDYLEANPALLKRGGGRAALEAWIMTSGAAAAPDLVNGKPLLQGAVAGLVMKVAAAETPASIGALMERMEGWLDRNAMLRAAFGDLPPDKRGEGLAWIKENLNNKDAGNSIMGLVLGIRDAKEAKAFLKEAIAGGLDPAVVEQLQGWGNYQSIMRSGVGPDSPIEERIDAMMAGGVSGKTEEEKKANARAAVVAEDLSRWWSAGLLQHRLRAGDLSAGELWAQAREAFPGYAEGSERDDMLRAFFRESAASDPEGALEILKKEGKQEDSARYAFEAISSSMHGDLEASMRLGALVPEDALRGSLALYDRHYSYLIEREAQEYGSYWNEWLAKQPPGLHRDLLLHYTAKHLVKLGQKGEAEDLKGLIRDPGIKERPLN